MKLPKFCLWFNEVGKNNIDLVGGKGANLGEMVQSGIPVPLGFIVTAQSYFYYLDKTNLREKIRTLLAGLNVDDSKKLQKVSEEVKNLIEKTAIPDEISEMIIHYYHKIEAKIPYVAVRSSATAEDLPDASFAGQQRTFLNVKGDKEVLSAVLGCWASLFEARAIFYRVQQGYDHFKVGIAVPVQKMVQSETSGIAFTLDPISNDRSKIVIEAVFGLGEAIVSGSLTPDQYLISKEDNKILEKEVVRQQWQFVRRDSRKTISNKKADEDVYNIKLPISAAFQKKQKLSDTLIEKLSTIVKNIENHYNWPQDIEWALENDKLFIVQTRPITTVKIPKEEKIEFETSQTAKEEPVKNRKTINLNNVALLEGLGASPGVGSGKAVVIHSPSDINKIKEGDILVTEMTTPDFVPAMKRATGIVTDRGGRTCHAAIVSRELGVPCVVGTEQATVMIKTGESITVDGSHGKVYEGIVSSESLKEKTTEIVSTQSGELRTATKVYVNSGEPDMAEELAIRPVDGIGLLRAEFMIANIGTHPKALIRSGKEEYFIDKLYEGLQRFAKAFDPRPVIYRTTDFKTNEYRNLKGGEKYEPENEANPMIGYRGCFRYITDPDVFKLELEAVKRVRRYHKNLWVMIPFVRTPEELIEAKKIMADVGLYRTSTFKIFMMVEIPSNVVILEKFIGAGIDGISIGSNDLTQLTLGLDRDNEKIAKEFDERNPAVLWMLEQAVTKASKHGISVSICGEAPSVYPEITQKLVEWGITSVSVEQDMIEKTRQIVYEAERKRVGLLR